KELRRVLGNRRLVFTLLLSSVLLAGNWLLYIYATVSGQVTEASLGYFMMPLVNAFLGGVFLGERLRPAHYPALGLVALSVCIPFTVMGVVPWLAVVLPITFGYYGLVRKKAPVSSFTGLTVETILLFFPSAIYLIACRSDGHFGNTLPTTLLLMCGGIMTVVPLLTYTAALKRLPLIALSFIQFLSPTLQLLLAVFVLEEPVNWSKWAAMACVWMAVIIFICDAVSQARKPQATEPASIPLPAAPLLAGTTTPR
ncbi:MAG: EamA family transporter RarD, partial [Gemmataceae bacterium]